MLVGGLSFLPGKIGLLFYGDYLEAVEQNSDQIKGLSGCSDPRQSPHSDSGWPVGLDKP